MSNPPDNADPKAIKVRVGPAKCARCDKPVQARYRPFCSQRCADLDLAAWLGESYRIPANEPVQEGETPGKDEDEG
ncbi:MAG: DNA gyrase inhibitor YacG [Candidatus Binataceae bacterium]